VTHEPVVKGQWLNTCTFNWSLAISLWRKGPRTLNFYILYELCHLNIMEKLEVLETLGSGCEGRKEGWEREREIGHVGSKRVEAKKSCVEQKDSLDGLTKRNKEKKTLRKEMLKKKSCIELYRRERTRRERLNLLPLPPPLGCVRDSFSPLPPLPPPPPHEFLALSREYEPEGGNNLHYNKCDVDR